MPITSIALFLIVGVLAYIASIVRRISQYLEARDRARTPLSPLGSLKDLNDFQRAVSRAAAKVDGRPDDYEIEQLIKSGRTNEAAAKADEQVRNKFVYWRLLEQYDDALQRSLRVLRGEESIADARKESSSFSISAYVQNDRGLQEAQDSRRQELGLQ